MIRKSYFKLPKSLAFTCLQKQKHKIALFPFFPALLFTSHSKMLNCAELPWYKPLNLKIIFYIFFLKLESSSSA